MLCSGNLVPGRTIARGLGHLFLGACPMDSMNFAAFRHFLPQQDQDVIVPNNYVAC